MSYTKTLSPHKVAHAYTGDNISLSNNIWDIIERTTQQNCEYSTVVPLIIAQKFFQGIGKWKLWYEIIVLFHNIEKNSRNM